MKKLPTVFALAVAAIACNKKSDDKPAAKAAEPTTQTPAATKDQPQAAATTEAKPAEKPKKLKAKDYADLYLACVEKINAAKYDDFMNDCIDTANFNGQSNDGPTVKAADLKQHFVDMHAAFPDMKMSPQIVLVEGHTVTAVALITGTNDGTMKMPGMADVEATHKKIGVLMAHELQFNFENNKVRAERVWSDPGTFAFQLGLLPKNAPAHRAAMDKGMDGAPVVVAIDKRGDAEKANADIIKKQNEAFNAHKPADVLATWTDDAVESDQASEKDTTGKKDIEKGLKTFLDAFSDAKITADVWGYGDWVVSAGHFDGHNDHDMGKMKKTGKEVQLDFVELSQMKDGKVTHVWRFLSSRKMAADLGLLPEPGKDGKDAKPAKK